MLEIVPEGVKRPEVYPAPIECPAGHLPRAVPVTELMWSYDLPAPEAAKGRGDLRDLTNFSGRHTQAEVHNFILVKVCRGL